MLSLDFIKNNRATVEAAIRDKGVDLDLDALLELGGRRGVPREGRAIHQRRYPRSARAASSWVTMTMVVPPAPIRRMASSTSSP